MPSSLEGIEYWMRAAELIERVQKQLDLIEPTIFPSGAVLYPCSMRLINGIVYECVYMVEPRSFKQLFRGVAPESVSGLPLIPVDGVAVIQQSPARLPARFANRIYQAGEHWGSHSFRLVFSWWCHRDYLVGELVDFLRYPLGRKPSDVKDVILHRSGVKKATPVPQAYWCVFSR